MCICVGWVRASKPKISVRSPFSAWPNRNFRFLACNLPHTYAHIPQNSLYDPKLSGESESEVRIVLAARNHELWVKIFVSGQAHQLEIPGQEHQTDGRFELSIKFWPRKPKLRPRRPILIEYGTQWRFLIFFFVLWRWRFLIFFFVLVNWKSGRQ